eukprot:21892_1
MALTTTYVHNYILSSLSRQLIFKKSVIFSPLLYVLIVLVSPALSTSMEFSITVMEHSTFAVISNNLTSTKVLFIFMFSVQAMVVVKAMDTLFFFMMMIMQYFSNTHCIVTNEQFILQSSCMMCFTNINANLNEYIHQTYCSSFLKCVD